MLLSGKFCFVAFANNTGWLHDVNLKHNQYNLQQVFYFNLFKEHMYITQNLSHIQLDNSRNCSRDYYYNQLYKRMFVDSSFFKYYFHSSSCYNLIYMIKTSQQRAYLMYFVSFSIIELICSMLHSVREHPVYKAKMWLSDSTQSRSQKQITYIRCLYIYTLSLLCTYARTYTYEYRQ